MQHDVVGDIEIVAVMIAGTVHEQQDELPTVLLSTTESWTRVSWSHGMFL